MTDNKPKKEITSDVLIADTMLRVAALEKLLVEKGVLTQVELTTTAEEIAERVTKIVLEKAKASKTSEEFAALLEKTKKDMQN